MAVESEDQQDARSSPRVLYQFSDDGIAFSGDQDFMEWQRRSRSINWWDLLATVFLLGAIPTGWLLWTLTASSAVAVAGFAASLAVTMALLLRKSWWALTGK